MLPVIAIGYIHFVVFGSIGVGIMKHNLNMCFAVCPAFVFAKVPPSKRLSLPCWGMTNGAATGSGFGRIWVGTGTCTTPTLLAFCSSLLLVERSCVAMSGGLRGGGRLKTGGGGVIDFPFKAPK